MKDRNVKTAALRWVSWSTCLAVVLCIFQSCIDEDLSKCGREYKVGYEMRLETNIETELRTELETITEVELGNRLRAALKNIFTDQAHDVDLIFYGNDSLVAYEESHIIDANQASYSIYLPIRDYQHIAVANKLLESQVLANGKERANLIQLQQQRVDTIESHSTGLFTARQQMSVRDQDQRFNVRLYMVNAAAAILVNPQSVPYRSIRGVMAQMADGFVIRDSVFTFDDNKVVRALDLGDTGSALQCIYGVSFPSRSVPLTRTAVRSVAEAKAAAGSYWQFKVYVTMPDGKVTETILHVREPLKAGQFKLVKTLMLNDGSLTTNAPEVGVSVTLDWKEGGHHDVEI